MINRMDLNGPGGIMPQNPFRQDPGIKQAPGVRPPVTPGATNPFQVNPGGGRGQINGPGGIMPPPPIPGQGNPGGTQYQQMRARRLARGQGGQLAPAGPGTGNINGPGGIQSPWAVGGGGGQGQINGPGGMQNPWAAGTGGGGQAQISGPGGVQNPNSGLPQPFPSTPFPGMTGGQLGGSVGTTNPYMPQFQQPMPQPQQMPQNPYNPYQNNWDWNQSGRFPGNRFPAY